MSHGKLESLITAPTAFTFTLSDTTGGASSELITIPATNTYYWSAAGNDSVDFPAKLKALMEAVSTNTYTVTIDATEDGTGALTIAVSSGLFTIVWTNSAVGELCGFTASISGQSSSTGTHVQGLWLPDCPFESPYGTSDEGTTEYDGSSTQSPNGVVVSTAYNSRTANSLMWQVVNKKKVRTADESSTNESYQSFYDDCIFGSASWANAGGPVNWHPDADTDATYVNYKIPVGQQNANERVQPDYTGYYRVDIPRLVKVP